MKIVTLIPVRRNDGSKVTKAEKDSIMNLMLERFGGVTQEGQTDGAWKDQDGTVYRDKCWKLSIAIQPTQLQEMIATIKEVGEMLDQRAMYLEITGVALIS